MVVDVGIVKNHITPKADSTLYNMRKADLIEYIRCLENNYNVAVSFNENQAKYIESLGIKEVVHGRWVKVDDGVLIGSGHHWECSECHKWVPWEHTGWHYCPNCGAKMDGERRERE